MRQDRRFGGLAPNKTYSAPVAPRYAARADYVPIDLDGVTVNKRNYDDDAPPASSSSSGGSNLKDISERTGIPLKLLQTLREQNGELILRGADLGYINARGQFEALISAGD